jgi:hypothetical protein
MFKNTNVTEEIYRSMEKQLVSHQVETRFGFKRLAQAADYLQAAAEIFDQAGMLQQADEITEVLQDLAQEMAK